MDHNNKSSKNLKTGNEVQLLSSLCAFACRNNSIEIPESFTPRNDQLNDEVFGNELLLEKILLYAVHTDAGKLKPKLVKKVRSIQISWLLTTTKVLKKLRQPVIKLTLNEENSLDRSDFVKEEGKLLNNFIETFTKGGSAVESSIPFELNLTAGFFWEENYESFFHCLTRLGHYIVGLEIEYPANGGTLAVCFPNLKLPSLRKLSFQFSSLKLTKKRNDAILPFGSNTRGIFLLQSIFNATEKLEKFEHPLPLFLVKIPRDFEFLCLPATILNLDLESNSLKVLLRNNLPNLETLTLDIPKPPLEDDLLHSILERVQKTLNFFYIKGLRSTGNPRPHTQLQFPVMKQLEEIDISTIYCELGPGEVSELHKCLPTLKYLTLAYQTEINFRKWIKKSAFKSVLCLEVSLVDEHAEDEDYDKFISPDIELIKRMHAAFQNVRSLELTFNVSNITGLCCIFQKMTQLETLDIDLKGNWNDFSSDIFDSTMLGFPLTFVTRFRDYNDLIQKIEFKSSPHASIRNLSELTKFSTLTDGILANEESSMLSEMLINHGLLQMPKLQTLNFYNKFKPSPDIIKSWEDDGRVIEYFVL